MTSKAVSCTFVVASLLCAGSLSAAEDALPLLDKLLSDISTMSADVTQLIVESDGGVLEESDIRMKLKRPDGFYWETVEPFPELVVTDGKKLWNYQPDLEQVVVEDWDSSRSELAAQLLNGNTQSLVEEYQLSLRDNKGTEFDEFLLLPLAADNVNRQITLTFNKGDLDLIHIESSNGQKIVWQFFNLEKNHLIPDSQFVFEPPAGVEVIVNSYVQ